MEQQEQSFSQRKAAQLGEERAQRGEVVPVTPTDLDAQSRETPDEVVESEDVEQDEIAHRDEHRHGKDRQRDIREEPPIARITVHRADRVDGHQQRNQCYRR